MAGNNQTYPQLSNIDFKLLRIFDATVRNEGFSAAQYELNMALPAISAAMTQLETRVGFKLCDRGRSGFHLTEGGAAVYEALQVLLASTDTFQDTVYQFKGGMLGRITIAVDDAIVTNTHCPLYQIVRQFVLATPNLDLDLLIMSPPEMEKSLLENRVSIGIGPFLDLPDALEKMLLYDETQQLCCGKGHPAFGILDRKQIDAAIALSDYAARSYNDGCANQDSVKFLKSKNTANMDALLALILTGRYVGYLSLHCIDSWVQKGDIWTLLPEIYSYTTPLYVAYKSDHNDPRVTLFLKTVHDYCD